MHDMKHTINVRGRLLDLSVPQVMGILNATPDSFFAGSRRQTETEIAVRANEIIEQGGTIIDVGAFSTRPGADEVSEQEETERLRRALAIVRREQPDAVLSVDTYRPTVARMCVEEFGADIINDVSEGGITGIVNTPIHEEESMFETVARLRVAYILMSVKPDLYSMMKAFAAEVQQLRDLGMKDVILDPGFGFGKTLEQNYRIMDGMERLHELGLPLLVGISRKSMISRVLQTDASGALNGTTVLNTIALLKGASILRVHDVRECVEAVKIVSAMRTDASGVDI
ncbi:dihydropteroate synthase [Prevotella sp. HCN-7019]|uniref:dihydropteroate synthase n=2 Tax=Prevotella sp. HCN-7019 TaxID=3134668 RepID=UPI0030BD8C78